ncbi:PhnD/SsuA/transferrin family substrate-binding protein [Sulfurimonas sp.]
MRSNFLFLFLFLTLFLQAQDTKIIAFYTKNLARVSDKDVQLAIHNILREAEKQDNITIQEKFPASEKTIINGFLTKKYALITLSTYTVMQNYSLLLPHIGKIWSIVKNKKRPFGRYFIITGKETSLQTIAKSQNMHAGYLRFDRMQHVYLHHFILKKFHKLPKKILSKEISFSSSSEVILKLFFKKIAIGVVSEDAYNVATELNPQLKEALKIVAKSKAIFPDIGLTFSQKGDKKIDTLYSKFTDQSNSIKNLSNMLMLYKAEAIETLSLKDLQRVHQFYKETITMEKEYDSKTTP